MSVMVMFFVEMLVQRYSPEEHEAEKEPSVGSEWGSGVDVTELKKSQDSKTVLAEPCIHAGDLESQVNLPTQTRIPGPPG